MKRKINPLQEQVEAQKTATEAQGKAQVQPVAPALGEGLATHNFTLAGDAEVQFGKIAGQHSAFTLADFAPVFLFRRVTTSSLKPVSTSPCKTGR